MSVSFYSGYVTLVGGSIDDYKSFYSPTDINDGSTVTLRSSHGSDMLSMIRIYVPPGTKKVDIVCQLDGYAKASKAIAKWNGPVSGNFTSTSYVTDTTGTIGRLVSGEELNFYSAPGYGTLTISSGTLSSALSSGGYIYIKLDVVSISSFTSTIVADYQTYLTWYNSVQWDSNNNPPIESTSTTSGTTSSSTDDVPVGFPVRTTITQKNINIKIATFKENTINSTYISLTNTSTTDTKVKVMISSQQTPEDRDFVLFDQLIKANGTYETMYVTSGGESLWISHTGTNLTVNVSGVTSDLTNV